MIRIQNPEQFRRAAERLRTEPQAIRRVEPHLYMVRNKVKNTGYSVRFSRNEFGTFAECSCPAGTPKNRRGQPQPCKHVAAILVFLRAVREMRRRACA